MRSRFCILFFILSLLFVPATAETDSETSNETVNEWGARFSAGTEMGLAKGLNLSANLLYSLNNDFKSTDKTKFSLTLSYRLYRNKAKTFNLKTSLGYEYSKEYMPEKYSVKDKGIVWDFDDNEHKEYNVTVTDAWWSPSHRAKFALSGKLKLGRFSLSVREMYRFCHTEKVDVYQTKSKYRYNSSLGAVAMEDSVRTAEIKGGTNVHLLRSRLEISYNIPHFKANPFIMAEMFNDAASDFQLVRMRYSTGFDMTFNKHQNLCVYFMMQKYYNDRILYTPGVEYTYIF